MKYIRIAELNRINNVCIIFDDIINHSDMVKQLSLRQEDIVSAGFVSKKVSEMGNPVFFPFGKSVTLSKESLKDDYKHLNHLLYSTFDTESY